MGYADGTAKEYTRQNDIFADAFNFYLYGGAQTIKPEQLRELDTAELSILPDAESRGKRSGRSMQRYRDVLKSVSAMEDGRAAYLLLGIENQSAVHYAAPVKNLLYDALQYAGQVERRAKVHREERDYQGRKEGEFLSGFYLDDKLVPVITLIIQFSPEPWDGPRSLRDMMDAEDPALLALVPDYPVHLLSPYELTEDENEKFHTSLGDVLTFIKYSKDKEKMLNWLEGAGADVQFGRREVDVLNGCVNAKLSVKQDKEAVNVCEAIRQMIEEATEDAVREVKAEAENAVREAKAEAENALKENTISSIRNLMANLHLTAEQAVSALGIPEADGKVFLKNL